MVSPFGLLITHAGKRTKHKTTNPPTVSIPHPPPYGCHKFELPSSSSTFLQVPPCGRRVALSTSVYCTYSGRGDRRSSLTIASTWRVAHNRSSINRRAHASTISSRRAASACILARPVTNDNSSMLTLLCTTVHPQFSLECSLIQHCRCSPALPSHRLRRYLQVRTCAYQVRETRRESQSVIFALLEYIQNSRAATRNGR